MRYAKIDAKARRLEVFDVEGGSYDAAMARAGLQRGAVDHGQVMAGIGIVVHEHGLMADADKQFYFRIGSRLYAGNALLYAFDEAGKTRDFPGDDARLVWQHLAFFLEVKADDGDFREVDP